MEMNTKPVGDSIPKVDDAIAVGEDLEFQRKWWKFERAVWVFFAFLILCDVLGLFGRGYLSKARTDDAGGNLHLSYERIERASTPSIMTFRFGPGAVRDGRIQLYVSESVVRDLGAQRVSPQPSTSVLVDNGLLYSFPASDASGVVQIALEPSFPGVHPVSVGLAGEAPIRVRVVVVP